MAKDLIRVEFRFPTHSEIRYLPQLPLPGELVQAIGEGFVVSGLVPNGAGYIATCKHP